MEKITFKKVKYNVWMLENGKHIFYGNSKRDCLRQLEEWTRSHAKKIA